MHFHLARAGAAAHAEILDRAAEARRFVALEVRQRDHDIRVHQRTADLGGGDVFAVHGDVDVVRALQTVGDQQVAADGIGVEAVLIGGFQMVEGVFPAADIERVAVGQEGLAAELLDEVDDGAGVIRAEIGEIARLAEMQLDRDILALQRELVHAGRQEQARELLLQVFAHIGVEIGKIDLRAFHR